MGDLLSEFGHLLDEPVDAVFFGLLLLAALLGWYLGYLAARLDRLHHRVDAAQAALQVTLVRRALAARRVATRLGGPEGRHLDAAAASAGEAWGEEGAPALGPQVVEADQNELSRALHVALADAGTVARLRADPAAAQDLADLAAAGQRVQMARRFHNDAVAHAQRMRRKRVVRLGVLAGRAPMPQMVEIDDSQPEGLSGDVPIGWPA